MKNSFGSWLVLLTLFIAIHSSHAFAEMADVQIKTSHVAGNIYMLQGQGGNIGVSVGEDGILLVDDQFAPLSEKIEVALAKIGKGKLKFVLNTHWHPDHTDGNKVFGSKAPIIAHTNVRKRLESFQKIKLFHMEKPPFPKEALPVITFDDSLSLHFNNEEIQVIHFPQGHTDGDSVIFFKGSNVVHMGDHFFSGRFPFIDLTGGGDVRGFINNVEKILSQVPRDVKIIPGHGSLSTQSDLKKYLKMLKETVEIVQSQINRGKSLEEVKVRGLPPRFDPWEKTIQKDLWLEIVYNSLKRD